MEDVIVEAALLREDEARTTQIVASLTETVRQLREMADYLQDLAQQPLEDQRTLH